MVPSEISLRNARANIPVTRSQGSVPTITFMVVDPAELEEGRAGRLRDAARTRWYCSVVGCLRMLFLRALLNLHILDRAAWWWYATPIQH